ncbi:MAG TPA: cation:proton antiporter [Dehalococcoidia bacterium]|nr:cation:proton antiporter [Dehalococcoidia bacterium]
MTILAAIFILSGVFFMTVSCLGLIRLPDFYSRTHAVGKSETLGAILLLIGLALHNGFVLGSLKLLIILVFVAIANPTATHAICRAALRSGLQLWTRSKPGS